MGAQHTGDHFETTRWSLIEDLIDADADRSRRAEEELARRYWPAVYAFLRRSGYGRDLAADLTQSFFVDVIYGRRLFRRADRASGRLRSLMLTALTRYAIDAHRRAISRGANRLVPAEAIFAEEHNLAASGPHDAFERRWAVAQLEEAMRRCERHFRANGRDKHWQVFEARILAPSITGAVPPPLAELADRLGFARAGDAAAAVQVVRKRATALLREVVAESVGDEREAELEFLEIARVLAG